MIILLTFVLLVISVMVWQVRVKKSEAIRNLPKIVSIEALYPVVGEVMVKDPIIEFTTDRFQAPLLGEVVLVGGVEYRCIDHFDFQDDEDYIRGYNYIKVTLWRNDI